MDKVRVIVRKEWSEVFKNRMVLFSVSFLPLVLTALPLFALYMPVPRETSAQPVSAICLPRLRDCASV